MAEIRKHRPKTSAIGDLVRSVVDSDAPRPVAPGEPVDDKYDPFFSEAPGDQDEPQIDSSKQVANAPTLPAAQFCSFDAGADEIWGEEK